MNTEAIQQTAQAGAPAVSKLGAAAREIAAELESLARRVRKLEDLKEEEAETASGNGEAGRLLRVKDVVKILGLSRSQVYRLASEGQLGAIKLGVRGVRFTERGLAEWQRQGGAL